MKDDLKINTSKLGELFKRWDSLLRDNIITFEQNETSKTLLAFKFFKENIDPLIPEKFNLEQWDEWKNGGWGRGGYIYQKPDLKNIICEPHETIIQWDLHSAYPSVLAQGVPTKQLSERDPNGCTFVKLVGATWKPKSSTPSKYPPMLYTLDNDINEEGKVVLEGGYVKVNKVKKNLTLIEPEYQLISKYYDIQYDSIEYKYFNKDTVYKDIMVKLYEDRKSPDKFTKEAVKTISVICTGVFFRTPYYKADNPNNNAKKGDLQSLKYIKYPPTHSWTTGWIRYILLKKIIEILDKGGSEFVCAKTDSCTFIITKPQEYYLIPSKKMGEFDVERVSKRFLAINTNMYMMKDEISKSFILKGFFNTNLPSALQKELKDILVKTLDYEIFHDCILFIKKVLQNLLKRHGFENKYFEETIEYLKKIRL